MPPETVERKIYFYRANVGADEGGRPLPFNPTSALQQIDALPFSPTGRYLDEGESRICCWVDRAAPHQHFRLGQIRRSGLPLLELQGKLSDLVIPIDSGLAETIHIVVFGNNIVGTDFNFHGPRISSLSRYFRKKGNGLFQELMFEPLLRQDVAAELDQLRDIRLFHLKIRAAYAASVAEADRDLGAAFEAAARAGNAEELEIVLRPRKHSRNPLADRMLRVAQDLIRRPDLRTEASKFLVKGINTNTDAIDAIDILSDQLIAREEIMRQTPRGRALDHVSAYEAVERAYGRFEDQLVLAAGVV